MGQEHEDYDDSPDGYLDLQSRFELEQRRSTLAFVLGCAGVAAVALVAFTVAAIHAFVYLAKAP